MNNNIGNKKIKTKESFDNMESLEEELPTQMRIPTEQVITDVVESKSNSNKKVLATCLRNEKISVTFIRKSSNKINDPKHVLYGGLIEGGRIVMTIPTLRNGNYVNILTDDEKTFLEKELGLEPNDLSIYKTKDNYWEDYNITLTKEGKTLDLNMPDDYIEYKVLLANTGLIAHSFDDITKKATYKFYLATDGDATTRANKNIDNKKDAYIQYGKIEEKKDDLKYIIQIMSNKIIAPNTKLEQLKHWVGDELEKNPKLFLEITKDAFYHTKKLIYKAVEYKVIRKQGDFYFIPNADSGLTGLCELSEEPTYNNAVKYLNNPKYQAIRIKIESNISKLEE